MKQGWQWATRYEIGEHMAAGMPRSPGCYAIYADGKLEYIGSSVNLLARFIQWNNHIQKFDGRWISPWGDHDHLRVKYRLSTYYGEWPMRELRLLRRLRPVGNTKSLGDALRGGGQSGRLR